MAATYTSAAQQQQLQSLQKLKSVSAPQWLTPSLSNSDLARSGAREIFSLLKPYAPKSPFEKLLVEGFDAEQVWQQIDLQAQEVLGLVKREVRRFESNPKEIGKGLKLKLEKKEKKKKEEVEIENVDEGEEDGESGSGDDGMDGDESESGSEEEEEDVGKKKKKKRKESRLDDEFLKMDELEEYLEKDEEREYGMDDDRAGKKKGKEGERGEEEESSEEEEDDEVKLVSLSLVM